MAVAAKPGEGPLDLAIERLVDAPARLIWAAWTEPERLKQWWAPRPWQTVECEIDLRPGGVFRTLMRSPEGDLQPLLGCYLAIEPERRLVWTNVLEPAFRPAAAPFLGLTTVLTLAPEGTKTRYRAVAMHPTPEIRAKHDEMGFHLGWNAALDQLLELVGAMKG